MDSFPPAMTTALAAYDEGLRLVENQGDNTPVETLVDVLLLRDRLQTLIHSADLESAYSLTISPEAQSQMGASSLSQFLSHLNQSDRRLKAQGHTIARQVPLEEWRSLLRSSEDAWWWFFQVPPIPPSRWDRYDWLWSALTVPFLTVNFALVVEISSHFVSNQPDTLGSIAVAGQGAMALLSASATLTSTGRQVVEKILKSVGLPKRYWHETQLIVALLLFVLLLGFKGYLPQLAQSYFQQGFAHEQNNQPLQARLSYSRALALDPNAMASHYRLGAIWEQLSNFEEAERQYEIAKTGGCLPAMNNLSHLYLSQYQDYNRAAALLVTTKQLLETTLASGTSLDLNADSCWQLDGEETKQLQAAIFKNLAWARLGQERYSQAVGYAEQATELSPQTGAAYCILALAQEAQGQLDSALTAWGGCLDFGREGQFDEDQWVAIAEERIQAAWGTTTETPNPPPNP